jgi:DNA-binding SARP family transcriptional activator
MVHVQTNLARLYLPLLAHHQSDVRQQACLILLGTFGDRALTYLRRLLDDDDLQVRHDARLALLAFVEVTGGDVKIQPFRGMHVQCLGRMRVYIGNHELQPEDWAQPEGGRAGWQKVQAALAYLVHCGRRGASRDALGAAVWGGPVSAHSMARTLTALRQALGKDADGKDFAQQGLAIEADYCILDPDCYHTDVQMFEQVFNMATQVEQERGLGQAAPLYEQAVQLYNGPYMDDVVRGSGWAKPRREYLSSSFVIAAERLAEHAYLQGRHRECIKVCTLALEADPRADDVVVWLLRAYAELGQHADLEQAYHGYLRAADLRPHTAAAQQDPVTQAYQGLRRERAQ